MAAPNELSESLEDYLEVIFELEKIHKVARARDIADRLQLQRGSVTSALKTLADKGFINYEPYSFITLTAKGKNLAREITGRHMLLKEFLSSVLQVDALIAEETACRLEHVIDVKSLERLACFMKHVQACPRTRERWLQSFPTCCTRQDLSIENCRQCIDSIKFS